MELWSDSAPRALTTPTNVEPLCIRDSSSFQPPLLHVSQEASHLSSRTGTRHTAPLQRIGNRPGLLDHRHLHRRWNQEEEREESLLIVGRRVAGRVGRCEHWGGTPDHSLLVALGGVTGGGVTGASMGQSVWSRGGWCPPTIGQPPAALSHLVW